MLGLSYPAHWTLSKRVVTPNHASNRVPNEFRTDQELKLGIHGKNEWHPWQK